MLDRPALVGGVAVEGPCSDAGLESYTDYMPIAVRHGMTMGELARFYNGEKALGAKVTVVPMQGWRRAEYFDETGLPWVNPSPNLQTERAAVVYPAFGFLETTNLSVGRGSATPFEVAGASWMNGAEVAAALNARAIPGVRFEATTISIAEDGNRYPFHGKTIDAVRIVATDRVALRTPEMGSGGPDGLTADVSRAIQMEGGGATGGERGDDEGDRAGRRSTGDCGKLEGGANRV